MSNGAPSGNMNIQEALEQAYAHWNAGQSDQAEMLAQRVLAAWPGQADALHLLGLMAHAFGNLDLAISHLRQACLAPRAPAAYSSNLAEMYRQKGMLPEGEEAAQRAVAMDPTLVSGWNNLGILLQEAGKLEQSRTCLERVVALTPEWAEAHNNLGNTWRLLGHMDHAQSCYTEALALNPSYAEAHSNLAFLLSTQGLYEDAASHAREAIELNPRLVDAYLNLADVEASRHRHEAALRALDMLNAFAPHHPAALIARAKILRQIALIEEALVAARHAVGAVPRSAEAHHTLALVLQDLSLTEEALEAYEQAATLPGTLAEVALIGRATLLIEAGRRDDAAAAFERVLEQFPGSSQAMAARSDLRTFVDNDPDIEALESFLAQGERRSLADRISAHFALGKAYLDTKNPALAFHHFDAGNQQKRASFHYDSKETARWFERLRAAVTPQRYAELAALGEPSTMPVFVLGMPRSGTTLIEQILSSHSQVTGAGELPALRLSVEGMGAFPEWIDALDAQSGNDNLLRRCGEAYLSRVTPFAEGRPFVVDKMPGNFVYAGLIPLILPGARIIHVRRDPVDTCLSCYSKLFSGQQSFAYNQTELGQFYREYERLMAYWRGILPADAFIEVQYEAVVDDLESEARRLLAFLGLPWDDACLDFHRNRRVVRTASVNQVRQPIYRTSKGRWHAYAPHLGPLLEALGVSAP
ncbi:tetratricopeptide repeat protein [Paraburkholderia dipogonis]|uniref:Tetratricopeptide repeat protein n=1 Tax=Paraburkholderia dipogonis TaxID=1211383 RepID=A0A4Y8MIJ5_9BURK|nr:sulfotransferase [Paraburkholderia dipogonis]TFE37310.1 tetratricopeptide repeat protein [Paraburkholderia dipogonis]